MPPALSESDDESVASDNLDEIPAKGVAKAAPVKKEEDEELPDVEEAQDRAEEEGDADEDEAEDTYVVEKIISHITEKKTGTILYHVKWLGYDNPIDETYEPEANLQEGASDILKAYFKQIGGRPEPETKLGRSGSTKAKRKRTETPTDEPAPTASKKRGRKSMTNGSAGKSESEGAPVGSTWEETVQSIETIEQYTETDVKGKEKQALRAYVTFNNGHKMASRMNIVRQNCPQKLIDYYEGHLYVHGEKVSSEDADM